MSSPVRSRKNAQTVSVRIRAVDGCTNTVLVDKKCVGRDIWDKFTAVFDLNEQDFFGLQYEAWTGKDVKVGSEGGTYSLGQTHRQWLLLDEAVQSQLGDPVADEMNDDMLVWEMEFRIKFYVGRAITDAWDDYARYLFFLQLRDDVSQGKIVVPEDVAVQLAGYAAQVQFGDWNFKEHSDMLYLAEFDLVEKNGELSQPIMQKHRQCMGMDAKEAESAYIDLAQKQEMYGVDLYFCKNSSGQVLQIGISPKGIHVFRRRQRIESYLWRAIKNIQFTKKKFMVTHKEDEGIEHTVTYVLQNVLICKTLWKSAIQHHTFFRRKAQPAARKKASMKPLAIGTKPEEVALSVGPTLYQAMESTKRRSHTTPQEGTLRRHLSLHTNAVVNRQKATARHTALPEIVPEFRNKRSITLRRRPEGFGFHIYGPTQAFDPLGIYVSKIMSHSAAADQGGLKVGDLIMTANGHSLANCSYEDALTIFDDADVSLALEVASNVKGFEYYANQQADLPSGAAGENPQESLIMARYPKGRRVSWITGQTEMVHGELHQEIMEEITIDIREGESLGVSITGGTDDPVEPDNAGIYINNIVESGAAHQDGRLRNGDRIREINSKSLENVTHDAAVSAVRSAITSRRVILLISRVIPSTMVTREQEFFGRHGVPRTSLDKIPEWQEGFLGPATEDGHIVVELFKSVGGYGIELIGTLQSHLTNPQHVHGVFISAVFAGGPAAVDGRLKRGDQIIEINGWQVEKATVKEASTLLNVSMANRAVITVRPNPAGFHQYAQDSFNTHYRPLRAPWAKEESVGEKRLIVLRREGADTGYGITLSGPATADDALVARGIFITSITDGGVAALDKRLRVGDQILEIDGLCLQKATHKIAAETLRSSGSAVKLLVAHNPEGFKYFEEDSKKINTSIWKSISNMELRAIQIARHPNAMDLGFSITGPPASATQEQLTGVFVTRISDLAVVDAGLRVGDQLVEVNSEKVYLSTQEHVIELLMASQDLQLVVTTNKTGFLATGKGNTAVERKITLARNGLSLGFELLGFDGAEATSPGFFVAHIVDTGAASVDGRLSVGDQLLEVDGHPLSDMTLPEVRELIACVDLEVTLTVMNNEEGFNPYRRLAKQLQINIRKSEEKRKKKSKRQLQQAHEVKQIRILRSDASIPLGFTICGPKDSQDDSVGIFIATIAENGLASQQPNLRIGDQIIMVDGRDLRLSNVEEATQALKMCGTVCSLVLTANAEGFAQYQQDIRETRCAVRDIELFRQGSEDWGLDVIGGAEDDSDIFISVIHAGGLADRNGGLSVGDQIISINGKSLLGAMSSDVIRLVRSPGQYMQLEVVENPEGFAPWAEKLKRRRASYVAKQIKATDLRLINLPSDEELGFELIGCSETEHGAQPSGVFVSFVAAGSSADLAGLKIGDQLIEVNGARPNEWVPLRTSTMQAAMRSLNLARESGKEVSLVVAENLEGYVLYSEITQSQKRKILVCRDSPSSDIGITLIGPKVPSPDCMGIFVADIKAKSFAEEQGLKVGDQILSINGESIEDSLLSEANDVLKSSGMDVTLVVKYNWSGFERCEKANGEPRSEVQQEEKAKESNIKSRTGSRRKSRKKNAASAYPPLPFALRALFDHHVNSATGLLYFSKRDILSVENVDDSDYWVAKNLTTGKEGKIPSRARFEAEFKRTEAWVELNERADSAVTQDPSKSRRMTFSNKTPEERREDAVQIHSYEIVEVRKAVKPNGIPEPPRPLLVVGPEALRISEAVTHILQEFEFVHAIPHTTRAARPGEIDGQDYFFASKEEMNKGLTSKRFIEAGRFKGNLYGTSVEAVRGPGLEGKVVVLDTQLKAVQRLQSFADIHPIVVFLKPTSMESLAEIIRRPGEQSQEAVDFDSLKALWEATLQTEKDFDYLFTHVIQCHGNLGQVVKTLSGVLSEALKADYWVDTFQALPLQPPADAAAKVKEFRPVEARSGGSETPPVSPTPSKDSGAQANAPVTVVVGRNAQGSFGFSVAGGIEDDLLPAIVIKSKVTPNIINGETLSNGDEILAVNGVNVAGESHSQVISMIKSAGNEVTLRILKRPANILQKKVSELMTLPPTNETTALLKEQVKRTLYDMTIPVTSRPVRDGEEEGREYHFVDVKEFELMIKNGELLEWGKFKGNYYGTMKVSPTDLDPDRRLARSKTFRNAMRNKERRCTRVNTVILRRLRDKSFGFRFTGGVECDELPFIETIMEPHVVSSTYGDVQLGDCILAINSNNVAGFTFEATDKLLQESGDQVELLLLCREPGAGPRSVREFLQPSDDDDAAMKAIKQDVRQGVYDSTVPITTRAPRAGEVHGVDYVFVTTEEFNQLIKDNKLLEWGEKGGVMYGTRREGGIPRKGGLIRKSSLAHKRVRKEQAQCKSVKLMRGAEGFGFQIEGRREGGSAGIFISKVSETGPSSEHLVKGMQIVEVNGLNLEGASQAEAIEALRKVEKELVLVVRMTSLQLRALSPTPARRNSYVNSDPIQSVKELANAIGATDVRCVELKKGPQGFGLKIAQRNQMRGEHVTEVIPGGMADLTGAIQVGDVIIQVDDTPVLDMEHDDVLQILRSSSVIKLYLTEINLPRSPVAGSRTGRRKVSLLRSDRGYGLTVVSDETGTHSRVGMLVPGGVADASGLVRVGDRIVSINGESVQDKHHEEVVAILKNSTTSVQLLLDDDMSPLPMVNAQSPLPASPYMKPIALSAPQQQQEGVKPVKQPAQLSQFVPAALQKPEEVDEDLVPVERRVVLKRGNRGLGFKITTDESQGLVRVSDVPEGGVAAQSGLVFVGDVIAEVNGQVTASMSHEEVISAVTASESVELLLFADETPIPEPEALMEDEEEMVGEEGRYVILNRGPNGLGLKIGIDSDVEGILVTGLTAEGAASQSGDVFPGDVIVEVNGASTLHMTHEEAVKALTAQEEVHMVVVSGRVILQIEGGDERTASPNNSGEFDLRAVHLVRSAQGLGMKISSINEQETGACVTEIVPGGPADASGLVRLHDLVVEVNGQNVLHSTHDEIIQLLVSSREVDLVLSSDAGLLDASTKERRVVLRRGEYGLGIKITTDEEQGIVRISEVPNGGVAFESGQVFVGDEIVEVNGEHVAGWTHEQVIRALTARDDVELLLSLNQTPLPLAVSVHPPVESEDTELRVAVLRRGDKGFGMKISSLDENETGACITEIVPGGPADLSGQVQMHDIIVEINGHNVLHASHNEVIQYLVESQEVRLMLTNDAGLLERFEEAKQKRVVVLHRGPNGLGIKISTDEENGVVRISDVPEGGVAHASGQVFEGDEVVSINGKAVSGWSHDQVIQAIISTSTVELVLIENQDPINYGPEEGENEESASEEKEAADDLPRTGDASAEMTQEQLGQRKPPGVPDEREVTFKRTPQGLGLQISSDPSNTNVRVWDVTPGGLADASGLVFIGDVIAAVNGVNMLGRPHEEVVNALRANVVTLRLLYDESPMVDESAEDGSFQEIVELVKGTRGLGFSFETYLNMEGIYVKSIQPGGPAAVDGRMRVGDQIVSVNGESLTVATHDEALACFSKPNTKKFTITLQHKPALNEQESEA